MCTGVLRARKKALGPLQLEFQVVSSSTLVLWPKPPVLCKSSKRSQPLNHLSSPQSHLKLFITLIYVCDGGIGVPEIKQGVCLGGLVGMDLSPPAPGFRTRREGNA